jgi:hypothetical protein
MSHLVATLMDKSYQIPLDGIQRMNDQKDYSRPKERAMPTLRHILNKDDLSCLDNDNDMPAFVLVTTGITLNDSDADNGENFLTLDGYEFESLKNLCDHMPFGSTKAIDEILEMIKRAGDMQVEEWNKYRTKKKLEKKHPSLYSSVVLQVMVRPLYKQTD